MAARLAADTAHRDRRGVGLRAALPYVAVGLLCPRAIDRVDDAVHVAAARFGRGADAVVRREARTQRAVRGDAEAIAALAIRVTRAGDEADFLCAVVPRPEVLRGT